MNSNHPVLLSTLILILLATSCGGTPTPGQTPPDADITRPEDTTLSKNTRILTPAARGALVFVSPDLSVLRFKTSPDTAFAPGQILVSQDTPVIPDGLLRRVLDVKVLGDLTEVQTDQASLEDAVENGDLIAEEQLALDDIEEQFIDTDGVEVLINGQPALIPQGIGGPVAQRLDPQATKTIGTLELKIKDKVLCQLDGDGKVVMNGSFSADFKVFASAKLKVFKLKHFDAGVEINEKSTVRLSGECSKTIFKKEIELARFKMRVRTYWIGPVPIIVRPEIVMTAGANGKISAKVDFSATHQFKARYGVKWDKGDGWNTINERSQSFTFTPPKFSVSLDAEGYIGARAGVRFYGLASAFVHPKIFADFGASVTAPQNTYDWKLDAGFRVGVGAEASLFGRQLGKMERDLVELRKTIASGSGKF